MAISDTLSDAAQDIREMLERQPAMYAGVRERIEALLSDMDRLRVDLDDPAYDPTGPMASVQSALDCDMRRR